MQLTRFERATHIVAPMPGILQYRSPTIFYCSPVTARIGPFTGRAVFSIVFLVLGIDKPVLAVQWPRAVASPVHESTKLYLNETE